MQEAGVVVHRRHRRDQHARSCRRAATPAVGEQRRSRAGRMPTRRAPMRLTAVARSALPAMRALEERGKQAAQARSTRADDQQHLAVDDEARRRRSAASVSGLVREPSGPKNSRPSPDEREVQRHRRRSAAPAPRRRRSAGTRCGRATARSAATSGTATARSCSGIGSVVPAASQTAAAGSERQDETEQQRARQPMDARSLREQRSTSTAVASTASTATRPTVARSASCFERGEA